MAKLYDETGFSAPLAVDEKCQALVDFVRPLVETQCGKAFSDFKCVEYSTQPIYGKNYRIKVATNEKDAMHLMVYEPPSRAPQLVHYSRGRSATEPLNEPVDTRSVVYSMQKGSFWVR